MNAHHYPAPATPIATPYVRRLVLIDTASRLATRILGRTRAASILVTDDIGPDEVEAFRVTGRSAQVFTAISDQLSKPN